MPPKSRAAAGAKKVRRKEKKNVAQGEAHIKSTFNNTIVTITDPTGAVISWASAGTVGFKGSRKSTPFAAQMAAEAAGRRAMEHGMKKIDVFVKGPGSGRETAIRSLGAIGLEVGTIQDVTPCAPQRMPAAQAPSRLITRDPRRATSPLHRPHDQEVAPSRCRPRWWRRRRTNAVPTRPASTAAAASRRASTSSSFVRSRRRASPTASSSASSTTTTSRHRVVRQDRRQPAPAARVPPRQRGLPRRVRPHASPRASARRARSLQGERQEGRHPVLPGHRPRRDRRAGSRSR